MPISAARWPHQIGERLGKSAGRSRAVCAHRLRGVCGRARSGRGGEPRSAKHRHSRSRGHGAAAAAAELQGLRRAAGLAGVELALAPGPHRSRAVAAKPVVGFAAGQHSSLGLDRNLGVPRSCHRHHRRRIRRRRRRGHDPAKRHHRPQAVRCRTARRGSAAACCSAPGATILGDISIGDFAKIGAGSVVEHDVPAGCTAVGVPARLTNCPEPATN